ncbi:MAG: hypothetical protein QG565_976, partial [Campylobacterota bacterium]|nr:hypothetical protein [Campylobacterota bacterium]
SFQELPNIAPNYFFVSKDFDEQKNYDKGFSVNELFLLSNVGIVTAKDAILINEAKKELIKTVQDYYEIEANQNLIQKISYRPFDDRFVYYDTKLVERAREKVMKNFLKGNNIGLAFIRHNKEDYYSSLFISENIIEARLADRFITNIAPLYLYPDENSLTTERTPNLNLEIVKEIEERLGLAFVNEKNGTDTLVSESAGGTKVPLPKCNGTDTLVSVKGGTEVPLPNTTFAPIDILDYIYAVLHSPTYREKYKEFLKIDFPRVPYPQAETFWELVKLGGELRSYHLLENPKVYEIVISLNESENNTIERKIAKKDVEIEGDFVKLWLNDEQYIDKIPLVAWEFYIGGYQPAQKWLKDRAGREMREEDYEHYNKIIVALTKTHDIMQKIDEVFEV